MTSTTVPSIAARLACLGLAAAWSRDLRAIEPGIPLPRSEVSKNCPNPLPTPASDFPCSPIGADSLDCPDGRLEWLVVEAGQDGCPRRTIHHASISVHAHDPVAIPMANTPMRARWLGTSALSPVLFRAEPRFGAIRTRKGVVLWSLDGQTIRLGTRRGVRLAVDRPMSHEILNAATGEETFFFRREGHRWDWLVLPLDPFFSITPKMGATSPIKILSLLEPASDRIRMAWSAYSDLSAETLDGLEFLAIPFPSGDTIRLRPTRSDSRFAAGDTSLNGHIDSIDLLVRRGTRIEAMVPVPRFDAPLGNGHRPETPVLPTAIATSRIAPPRSRIPSPVVVSLGDSLLWGVPDSTGALESPRLLPETWGWAFDSISPAGRPQEWTNSRNAVPIDSLIQTESGLRFHLSSRYGSPCLAHFSAEGEFGAALGPGDPDGESPKLSTRWFPLEQNLDGDEFMRLNGWAYREEPETYVPPHERGIGSSSNTSSPRTFPIAPTPHRTLGWTCPDSFGWYAVSDTRATSGHRRRWEFYGFGDKDPVRFSVDQL